METLLHTLFIFTAFYLYVTVYVFSPLLDFPYQCVCADFFMRVLLYECIQSGSKTLCPHRLQWSVIVGSVCVCVCVCVQALGVCLSLL